MSPSGALHADLCGQRALITGASSWLGRLQDLNGPLLLLASEASKFMTGAVIVVDGGHL
jgi:NAD(P)-dependent dehydrogenase (short-subunit alcohol dehydrogenase family)